MLDTAPAEADVRLPSTAIPVRALQVGFAVLRVAFGVNWLSNAIAKLIGNGTFGGGFFSFNLVDRATARAILEQGTGATPIAPLRAFYTDVVLANWGFFAWFLTVTEFAIGLGLLFGVASRLASLGGVLLLLPIWVMLFGTNQYLWTYPLDIFPLVLLAIVPAGRALGLDGRLVARFGDRWPF